MGLGFASEQNKKGGKAPRGSKLSNLVLNLLANSIFREMLEQGEDVATCPSCSLIVRVIYDLDMFVKLETLSISDPPKTITDPV